MKSLFKNEKTDARHEIENMLDSAHAEIKPMAYSNGKSKGMKEPPLPLAKGDKLIHHIADVKARYEQLGLKLLNWVLPEARQIEGRMHRDWAELHNQRLLDKINEVQKQILSLDDELRSYDPSHIASRIMKANLACSVLFVGEVVLNTQAFQVTGDNLLSSLTLSASVSAAICMGAHFAGRKYKDAKSITEKRIILIGSAIGITIVSGVIASLRSIFLQKIGMDVNPIYFTIFNVVFFVIAAIATWYLYPSKEEIKQNRELLQKYSRVQKLKAEKEKLENEQIEHEKATQEILQQNIRAVLAAEYAVERVRKLYTEAIGTFIGGNLLCRKDIPECVGDPIPELDIPHIAFKEIIKKYKSNEKDENNKNNNNNLAA